MEQDGYVKESVVLNFFEVQNVLSSLDEQLSVSRSLLSHRFSRRVLLSLNPVTVPIRHTRYSQTVSPHFSLHFVPSECFSCFTDHSQL